MGKRKHSDDDRGEQKGAQAHAEGQHGAVTRSQLKQQINNKGAQEETHSTREANDPNRHGKQGGGSLEPHEQAMAGGESDGKHRLFENRKQHDEADLNSGKNRLNKDVSRHGHEREQFQIPGGRETHPALPQDGPDGTIKSPGQG